MILPDSPKTVELNATELVVVNWLRSHPSNAGRLRDTLECHSIPGDWVGGDSNGWRASLVQLHAMLSAVSTLEAV